MTTPNQNRNRTMTKSLNIPLNLINNLGVTQSITHKQEMLNPDELKNNFKDARKSL